MNKQSLIVILGAALIGCAKKGSLGRRSLDDYFKNKVGNPDQTFKISLDVWYKAIVKDNGYHHYSILSDFSKYIPEYIDFISVVVEGFRGFIESDQVGTDGLSYWYTEDDVNDREEWGSKEDFFDHWCRENEINYYEQDASRYRFGTREQFGTWEWMYFLSSKSKMYWDSFPIDTTEVEILDEIEEDNLLEAEQWIQGGYLGQNIGEYPEIDVFIEKLYRRGYIGRFQWEDDYEDWEEDEEFVDILEDISWNGRPELKDLLNQWSSEILRPHPDQIDWEMFLNTELRVFLDCRLDEETLNVSKNDWLSFVYTVLNKAYIAWQEDGAGYFGDLPPRNVQITSVSPPNIFSQNKKTSKLRRR